jgi:AcrR family transcriptional regulator
MGTTGTLRERHAARTREAIVSAAVELFDQRGFSETTVDEIAARADVAPRTFFRYFPTKEAVLFPDADAKSGRILAALAARPAGEHPFASLVAVILGLADEMEAAGPEIELRQRVSAGCPAVRTYERTVLEARVADTVAAFVADRLGVDVSTDPRPRVWASLAMSTFRIALHRWLDTGRTGRLRDAVDDALAAVAEGVAIAGPYLRAKER